MTTSINTQTTPGSSIEKTEKTLLCSILGAADPLAAFFEALAIVTADDFSVPAYRELFTAIDESAHRFEAVTQYTISELLRDSALFAKIGGESAIIRMGFEATGYPIKLAAASIQAAAQARRVAHAFDDAKQVITKDGAEAGVEAFLSAYDTIRDTGVTDESLKSADQMHQDFLDNLRNPQPRVAYTYGLTDLDEVTGGLKPQQLITIAAGSGVGKSQMGLTIARAIARKGMVDANDPAPVLFVAMEMSHEEMEQRRIAATCKIDMAYFSKGFGKGRDAEDARAYVSSAIAAKADVLKGMPLEVWSPTGVDVTIPMVKAYARKVERKYGRMPVIIIDYIQMLAPTEKSFSRQEAVQSIARAAKAMARELNVPVVAMAQMNRAAAQRVDKRPITSDIRESGGIVNDSDVIIMIHREYKINPTDENMNDVDLIIGKNRNGVDGITIEAIFQGHYARIVNLDAAEKVRREAKREQEKAAAAAQTISLGQKWGTQ